LLLLLLERGGLEEGHGAGIASVPAHAHQGGHLGHLGSHLVVGRGGILAGTAPA